MSTVCRIDVDVPYPFTVNEALKKIKHEIVEALAELRLARRWLDGRKTSAAKSVSVRLVETRGSAGGVRFSYVAEKDENPSQVEPGTTTEG